MTDRDVKNYLEQIYKVPVMNVRMVPKDAKIKRSRKGYLIKEGDDYCSAYVQMPAGMNFEFPDLFPKEKRDEEQKIHDDTFDAEKKVEKEFLEVYQKAKDVPTWFS